MKNTWLVLSGAVQLWWKGDGPLAWVVFKILWVF
jgi:hypothetical protein